MMTFDWDRLGKRAGTMLFALEWAGEDATIMETGCVRSTDGWLGDGMSTVVFAEWTRDHGGDLWSVDNDPAHVATATMLAPRARVVLGDSVAFLRVFDGLIDLLYLDSLDYPHGALLDLHGEALSGMSEDEIVRLHGDLVLPSQEHCAAELVAAMPRLHRQSVVLIDDAALPGGGKARLARGVLLDAGWRCAMDAYQTAWVRA